MDARTWLGLEATHNPHALGAAGRARHLAPAAPSCSAGAASAPRSRRWRARRGRPVVWATAQYLSYATPPSVLDIDVTVAVAGPQHHPGPGRRATSADTEILTVNAALGAPRPRGRRAVGRAARRARRPTSAGRARTASATASESIMDRLDMRLADGPGLGRARRHPPATAARRCGPACPTCSSIVGAGARHPRRLRALRHRPGARALRPAATASTTRCGSSGWCPTEWVLLDIRIHAVANGFGHGLVHLWAEDGTLLATASQSTIVRTGPPSDGGHGGARRGGRSPARTRRAGVTASRHRSATA